MPTLLRVMGRLAANLARGGRRLFARAALPRGQGAWLLVRLEGALEELPPPRVPFAPPSVRSRE